jgi:23S rRNA (cytosine1962-C5)-methyltransferase
MFQSDQYQAIDFGEGKRLERFGELVLDRPCPAAEFLKKKSPSLWSRADAIFKIDEIASKKSNATAERGNWIPLTDLGQLFFASDNEKNNINPADWQIRHDQAVFLLRGTPFGHVGVFPEQAKNWDTIKAFSLQQTQTQSTQVDAFRVLNLFAYTGGSTLAVAQGKAEVVHVDSAKNVVAWARKNAEFSQIAPSQIRWVVEDAQTFVRRELKRGNKYQCIILDPPSYGHGANGEVWRFSKHLPKLLLDCIALLKSDLPCFFLLTCHTPGFSLERLTNLVEATAKDAFGDKFVRKRMRLDAHTMTLRAESGATLPSGESVMFFYE